MFQRNKPTPSPTLTELPISPGASPKPVPVTSGPLEDNELRAYVRTAEAIGFAPAELLEAKLLGFFAERGIPRYDYAQVARYLSDKARRAGQAWFWRPLRAQDRPQNWRWGSAQGNGVEYLNDWYDERYWCCRPYHRAVPLRVLARAEMIAGAFPSALFFVTDMASVADVAQGALRPDPFICVTALDMPRLIFDVWDEPGFAG